MLDVQLPRANQLRPQRKVRRGVAVPSIEVFIAVGCAEGPAIDCPYVCIPLRAKKESHTRTQSVPELIMPVIAQAKSERQVFPNGILVLKIERPNERRSVVLQIQQVRLDVVIHLLLL